MHFHVFLTEHLGTNLYDKYSSRLDSWIVSLIFTKYLPKNEAHREDFEGRFVKGFRPSFWHYGWEKNVFEFVLDDTFCTISSDFCQALVSAPIVGSNTAPELLHFSKRLSYLAFWVKIKLIKHVFIGFMDNFWAEFSSFALVSLLMALSKIGKSWLQWYLLKTKMLEILLSNCSRISLCLQKGRSYAATILAAACDVTGQNSKLFEQQFVTSDF